MGIAKVEKERIQIIHSKFCIVTRPPGHSFPYLKRYLKIYFLVGIQLNNGETDSIFKVKEAELIVTVHVQNTSIKATLIILYLYYEKYFSDDHFSYIVCVITLMRAWIRVLDVPGCYERARGWRENPHYKAQDWSEL